MLKQSIIELYDEYTNSGLPRPHFFWKDWPNWRGNFMLCYQCWIICDGPDSSQDIRLSTGTIEIPTPNGPIQAYVAKPKNAEHCILYSRS